MVDHAMHDALEGALEVRRDELLLHAERCESVLRELRRGVLLTGPRSAATSPDAASTVVGAARDLVETRSRLAQVRRDLRRLRTIH